jgi:sterol desaturase/sphingolipid hydroxylase (fatty acid hydroxylase superfamily)
MSLMNLLLAAAGSLIFLSFVFIPLEKAFPAKKSQPIFRKHWLLDLCYFAGQYLLWSWLVLWILNYFNAWFQGFIPLSFRSAIQSQPIWLQGTEVIVLSDLLIYWGHRLQHKVDFLWRFHKVHHSSTHLDWLAAHREHPLDSIYTIGLINLPAFMMGFDLEALTLLIAFRAIWAIYIHSNVRLPIGPLKILIGSPELHHWHHDIERDAGNYANISPLMDKLFGTYVCPPAEPEQFGIREDFPQSYTGQLLSPMLPKKWKDIFKQKKKKQRNEC